VGDVQGERKYAVGPNSVHPKGGVYKVVSYNPVAELSSQELSKALGEWIIPEKEYTRVEACARAEHLEGDLDINALIPAGMSRQGDEYYGPHPVHGSDNGHNFWVKPAEGSWHCFRHSTGGGAWSLLAVLEGIIRCEDAVPGGLRGDLFKQTRAKAIERGLVKVPNFTKVEEGTEKPDMDAVLTFLKHKYVFKSLRDTDELFLYDAQDGIYVSGESQIKGEVEELLGSKCNTHFVKEVLDHFIRANYCDRDTFNVFTGQIPVENGLLDLVTRILEEYSPEKPWTFKLNTAYAKGADCPKFKAYLMQAQPTEDNQKLLQEYGGYIIYIGFPFHVFIVFYGQGRNGKGVFARTMEGILGKANCKGIPLEALDGSNRFQMANLWGKLLNTSSEPAHKRYFTTETFKRLTGGDMISAEKKGIQKTLDFTYQGKFIIMGNSFPRVLDNTDSFWLRMLILPWTEQFTLEKGNQIQDIEQTWLTDPEERSGILNWQLDGLDRLLEKKRFSTSKSIEETKQEFRKISDPITAFLTDECQFTGEETRKTIYSAYKDYCRSIGAIPEGPRVLAAQIEKQPGVKEGWIRVGDKSERTWRGLSLKTEIPPNSGGLLA
jgi:P4 family phage/plasmid primase-like protien